MMYGVEVVIPAEISLSSMRVASFSLGSNDVQMIKRLDLLEESQDMASIQLANYQQKLANGLGSAKSSGKYERPECRKVRSKLERTLPSDCSD